VAALAAASDVAAVNDSAPTAAPVAAAAPPMPAPPARIELPSASAAYLNNPPPAYPPLSRRLGETGKVTLRVLVQADGTAGAVEIYRSSGYARLDQAAQQAVQRWRFVPGKRNGEPQAMWFLVPIQFVLE
jgi:protein TonB